MDDVTFRPYRPGDEVAINEGFNEVFGLSRSLDEWRWKFPDQPEGRFIMLALDPAGRVFAHYAAVAVPFQAQGRHVTAGQIVDIYSRREARAGLAAAHVFRATVRAFVTTFCRPERIAAAYGFPGTRHMSLVRIGVASLGEAEMPPLPVPVWTRPTARRGARWPHHEVTNGFDAAAIDGLWLRAAHRYPVAVVRDAARARARFLARPGVEYVHLVARRRSVPHAWGVVRLQEASASLADLAWDGDDPRALAALDRAVGDLARRAGVIRTEMWLSGDPAAEEALARLGWDRGLRPDGLAMAAYTFHSELDVSAFPASFYLTMGDADLV